MLRSVGKIRDGEDVFIIFDIGVAPLHIDLITEVADEDGIVRISFAAITQDGDGQAKAEVTARIRMKQDVAWRLCKSLNTLQK